MGSYVKNDKKTEDEVNPPVLDFGPILGVHYTKPFFQTWIVFVYNNNEHFMLFRYLKNDFSDLNSQLLMQLYLLSKSSKIVSITY